MAVPKHLKEMWGVPRPHTVRYAEVPLDGLKGRVIRCAGYNTNTLGHYQWCWAPSFSRARKPKFMAELRKSVEVEGVRNPVTIYAFPEGDFLSFGGSRVLAAMDVGLSTIPAIINDYCGRYKDAERVTKSNWQVFFTDIPKHFEFTDYGIEYHYGMEKNRRQHFDGSGLAWTNGPKVDNTFLGIEFGWLKDYERIDEDE